VGIGSDGSVFTQRAACFLFATPTASCLLRARRAGLPYVLNPSELCYAVVRLFSTRSLTRAHDNFFASIKRRIVATETPIRCADSAMLYASLGVAVAIIKPPYHSLDYHGF